MHKVNPVGDAQVRPLIADSTRTKGPAQRKKDALTGDRLRNALLMPTFACAGRRLEIAAVDIADIRFERGGLVVIIRRSKTDHTGAAREIGVPG